MHKQELLKMEKTKNENSENQTQTIENEESKDATPVKKEKDDENQIII